MADAMEDAILQQMREDGTMDWVREQMAKASSEPGESSGEESGTDSADATEGSAGATEEEVEAQAALDDADKNEMARRMAEKMAKTPAEETKTPPEEGGEEEGLFLDLSPEDERWLSKYGYDPENPETLTADLLAKAIQGGRNAESLIGRRTEELSEERIAQLVEERVSSVLAQNAPLNWPDEEDEPEEAVEKLQAIAESAFAREDLDNFVQAFESWKEIDPLGANAYRLLKLTEARVLAAGETQQGEGRSEPTLEEGMRELQGKFPKLNDPEFQQALGLELQKKPTLGRLLRGEIPGTTVAERLSALDELATAVAGRQTDETSRRALKRVAVQVNEEAAAARREARVATGGAGSSRKPAEEDTQIRLGKTSISVSQQAVEERLAQIFGHKVGIGE